MSGAPGADADLAAVESELHERARSAAGGRSDFGDPQYRVGLRRLLVSLRDDQGLDPEAALDAVAPFAVARLVGRLYAVDGFNAHPGLCEVELRDPLFITGIPRTGTTALHQLLAADSRFQGLESWLAATPMPRPPRSAWPGIPEFRSAAARAAADRARLEAIHWVDAGDYDETLTVLHQTFQMNYSVRGPLPGFEEWYLAADARPVYRWAADVLRLVGSTAPERPWLLKNPSDIIWSDAVLDVFPGARIVVTHRDPVAAIPSTVSLLVTLRRGTAGTGVDRRAFDVSAMAERELRFWKIALDRYEAARARRPDRYLDVWQRDLLADPLAVVRAIYDWAGLALSRGTEEAMRGWIAADAAARASHRHEPGELGLDPERIAETFAGYRARFGFA